MNLSKTSENMTKQQLFLEILTGLKEKFLQPLINENKRLTSEINKKREQDEKVLADLVARVERLEEKITENPITILSAIRDAINQSNGGKENGSNHSV